MITQGITLPNKTEVNEIKGKIKSEQEVCVSERALKVEQDKTPHTLNAMQDAKMSRASSWLEVLPLVEFCFTLNKGEFKDALSLRYGRPLKDLSVMFPCGKMYKVAHALNCSRGGTIM